ncbi:MAG: SGNH/GDSL hydrolase family protein [Planctomycetota bacterium]|nr:SGNH/GDSL hydrolase family protein [Planctomycetota bacterium]
MRTRTALATLALLACAATRGAETPPAPKTEDLVDHLLDPFWSSQTMHGEALFFAECAEGEASSAALLFPPERVLAVRSANGETAYEEGKDYVLDQAAGVLKLAPGSRIPSKKLGEMYPPADSKLPKIGHKRGEPKTCLIWSEGHFFHDLQVSVTYTHAVGAWKGYVPAFAGEQLPRTLKKLRAKEPLTVCLSGDSISQGYNASGYVNAPPQQPAYGTLVAQALEKKFGSKIEFHNFAIAGWTSQNGVADVGKVAAKKPDLVLIAYGMNDSGGRSAEDFAKNLTTIMAKVREAAPEAEFVLVSPMLPNAEWSAPNLARFPEYQKALEGLRGKGVAYADVTAVWTEMLKRKRFHDLTGNGVNHPNDFGHRVYAQVILGLFAQPAK